MGLGPLHTVSLKDPVNAPEKPDNSFSMVSIRSKRVGLIARKQLWQHQRRSLSKKLPRRISMPMKRNWRNAKHRNQFISTLKEYVFPKLGKLAVADIDIGSVLSVLEPIWHTKTETTSRVRSRIEAILDWATVRKLRSGDNPAR
jgi:hypothetical protein